jgi:hypothetical protein
VKKSFVVPDAQLRIGSALLREPGIHWRLVSVTNTPRENFVGFGLANSRLARQFVSG